MKKIIAVLALIYSFSIFAFSSESASIAFVEGCKAYSIGDWSSAKIMLKKTVSYAQNQNADTYYMLISAEINAGDYKGALEDCNYYLENFKKSIYYPRISYQKGKLLKDRNIDLLEFGRSNDKVFKADQLKVVFDNRNRSLNHVCTKQNGKFIYTNKQLYEAMGSAKVTIALPRSITQSEIAGDIETLTQRYWECMFSRMVMVGHAPQELIDFIGYNPVIELSDKISPEEQIANVIEHIEDYQSLVDKNRETAEKMGSWDMRMKWLMGELEKDYRLKK